MSRHQPFSNLTANFTSERKAKIAAQTENLEAKTALDEIRQAFSLTKEQLASKLKVEQSAIPDLEQRSNVYISHLREVIEAMGGKLKIVASFGDRSVKSTDLDFTQAGGEDMVNLSIKVPRRLRQKWVAESRLKGTTLTAIITEYLNREFGK